MQDFDTYLANMLKRMGTDLQHLFEQRGPENACEIIAWEWEQWSQERKRNERVTVYTDAPAEYDYHYVEQVSPCIGWNSGRKDRPVRHLTIPRSHVGYQVPRYQSGLYLACVEDEALAQELGVSVLAKLCGPGLIELKEGYRFERA